jgi:hypothetical protein
VTLLANPDPGQQFLEWGSDLSGTTNPLQLVVTNNAIVRAVFTKRPTLVVEPCGCGMSSAGFRFILRGEPGPQFRVEATADWQTWEWLGDLTNYFGAVQFTDPAAQNDHHRFYRAVEK